MCSQDFMKSVRSVNTHTHTHTLIHMQTHTSTCVCVLNFVCVLSCRCLWSRRRRGLHFQKRKDCLRQEVTQSLLILVSPAVAAETHSCHSNRFRCESVLLLRRSD